MITLPLVGTSVNRFELFNAMINRDTIKVGGLNCLVQGIELEDSSGHNFNVTILVGSRTHKVYVKG